MRRIVAQVRSNVTELRCSDCEWKYPIHHLSQIVDSIEEQQATRLYIAHDCNGLPTANRTELKAS
jgi:hypothetical protein